MSDELAKNLASKKRQLARLDAQIIDLQNQRNAKTAAIEHLEKSGISDAEIPEPDPAVVPAAAEKKTDTVKPIKA